MRLTVIGTPMITGALNLAEAALANHNSS